MRHLLILVAVAALAGCQPSANPNTTSAPVPAPAATGRPFAIDPAQSNVAWTGTAPGKAHIGTVAIQAGALNAEGGTLTGGTFAIDLNSIVCTDLTDPQSNADLVGHLKSADFFDAAAHPTGTFVLATATPAPDAKGNTHAIAGNLTLRGVTKPISFPARVEMTEAGIQAQAKGVVIDRTQWGITYKSATIAGVLKDKAIGDNITLDIALVAKP